MASTPVLAFLPYLPLNDTVEFGDWQIGPLADFNDAWADPVLRDHCLAFVAKFVDHSGRPLARPSALSRINGKIDGELPSEPERLALELAVGIGLLEGNPRREPIAAAQGWTVLTSDNTEPYFWPVDVGSGNVVLSSGLLVRTIDGGYTLSDPDLTVRPPLELHLPLAVTRPDAGRMAAYYRVFLGSLTSPGANRDADRLTVAVGWYLKAWRNTTSLRFPERVVFLKTAFEALTGTSNSREAAAALRRTFESLPGTEATDSQYLVWSPTETELHPHSFRKLDPATGKKVQTTEHLTDLEHWFMALAHARNAIIHDGRAPGLNHRQPGTLYEGHLFWTAEFVFRAFAKASLSQLGYPHIWKPEVWRDALARLQSLEGAS